MDVLASTFIDGSRLSPDGRETLTQVDPSTGRESGLLVLSGDADVSHATASSRKAFEAQGWRSLAPSARKKLLLDFADLIEREGLLLDRMDAADMGKPVSLAVFNAVGAAGFVRYQAEAIDKCLGEQFATPLNSHASVSWEPRGVVAAIVPWNFPTYNAILKVAPALAAGNTVVLKPSELASTSAVRLAELAMEAGLMPGAFNVVTGTGANAGAALASHMDVDMIAFTGSTAVGKRMLAYSGESNMKTVLAECGGKSPQIVFEDCHDLDEVALAVAAGITMNQGQVCSVGSRILVQNSVKDRFVERVHKNFDSLIAGAALSPTVTYGPLANKHQLERVSKFIDDGAKSGKLHRASGLKLPNEGYFVAPAVFDDVDPQSKLAQEEIFGPVISVLGFNDMAEAIRLANATNYGLASYVWTTSLATGHAMNRALRAGVVFVNAALQKDEGPGHALTVEPFGQSGIGVESGLAGLRSYLRRQLLWISY